MVGEISLSAATQTNLLALQRTTKAIEITQERLSTGLRVNSAVDDSIAFFSASTLTHRAADLQVLKDDIDQAVSSAETAVSALEAIDDIVEQMKGLALSAKSDSSTTNRSKSAVQFNDLKDQLDNLANDATYSGTNLIKGSPGNLKVTFSEDGSSTLTISGISSDSSGLSIAVAASNWAADSNIDVAINDLDSALTTLRSSASTIGSSASMISLRLDFVTTLISQLEEGAAKLTNADLNEESANLLTLQTRQQLGTIGLSIAQSSDQSVLRLFF
ncbi:MAG: flagellin [Rhodospirillaceae bacterium]|jgi:flagellin|nr:flagellin [Rhodospirillaceae bacterium]MBT7265819.1 flagellin [Rhodospirillaceae bacterium]